MTGIKINDVYKYMKELEEMKRINEEVAKAKGVEIPFEHAKMYADSRYNTPKSEPSVEHAVIDKTIAETEIYRRARLVILQGQSELSDICYKARDVILKAQQRQVGYGLEKYPEPLNSNTWSISETIGHIIDESIDRIHYLVMLYIKFEQTLIGKESDRRTWSIIESIAGMIESAIEELYNLVMLNIEMENVVQEDLKKGRDDKIDALAYAHKVFDSFTGADVDGDVIYADDMPVGKISGAMKLFDIDTLLDKHEMGKLSTDELRHEVELRKAGLK